MNEDINLHITAIQNVLDEYLRSIEDAKRIYSDLNAQIKGKTDEFRELKEAIEQDEELLREQVPILENQIAVLVKEKQHLEADTQTLVASKSELMITNAQLHKDNLAFKTYEKTALVVLEAKESELEAKENQINQKLGLQPKSRILPPR